MIFQLTSTKNSFCISKSDFKPPITIHISASFHENVKQIPPWKKKFLQNIYTRYPTCLVTTIQQCKPLLLATDGYKSDSKYGGVWVVSSPNRNLLAHGSNPDFGCMENMHSRQSESYTILSALLFLH